jgi:Protein of unknown function (DUF3891)
MIVNDDGKYLRLITQPDHARLAGDIAEAWHADGWRSHPQRDVLLLAIREHDNGWIEPDAEPAIDPQTGHPYDFVSAPQEVKQAIWPRGVERLARQEPLAAAFVAQHALTIFADHRSKPSWSPFFDRLTTLRDALLDVCEISAPDGRAAFARDYRLLFLADFLSLAFCNDWQQTFESDGYQFAVRGDRLVVMPDPFGAQLVSLSVPTRQIPSHRYQTTAEFHRALADAEEFALHGIARGGRV